ncbi:MAG: hypothetical protein RMY36_008890 [Nostoc sp. SerVER01]|nr:hypothetical protein [Nostoc sp. SerVER01]
MNEEECQATYQRLRSILLDIGLHWVVQLATEEISIGRIIRQNGDDLAAREYTPKERLKILINLIKQSIVDKVLIEERIIQFFDNNENFSNLNSNIAFASDIDEIDEGYFNINYDNVNSILEPANTLLRLLERITEDIEDDT